MHGHHMAIELSFIFSLIRCLSYLCLNIHLNLGNVVQLKPDCQYVYALKESFVPDVKEDALLDVNMTFYLETRL